MIFLAVFIIFYLSSSCGSCNKFMIEQSSDDDAIILRKILMNYLTKYISDDRIFISVVIGPSEKQPNQFHLNFFEWFLNDLTSSNFAYSLLYKLDNTTCDIRSAFNLIFVRDSESLGCVFQ